MLRIRVARLQRTKLTVPRLLNERELRRTDLQTLHHVCGCGCISDVASRTFCGGEAAATTPDSGGVLGLAAGSDVAIARRVPSRRVFGAGMWSGAAGRGRGP